MDPYRTIDATETAPADDALEVSTERCAYVLAIVAAIVPIWDATALDPPWGGASSIGLFVILWSIRGLVQTARRAAA